ncbi:MAG: 2-dehydro-3-deoxygalactonokinase [Hyphomicrobiales bacterium]|nr:2-dehydro-3-deoxygalactonokinase [Hyphomicrobiales bacterium]
MNAFPFCAAIDWGTSTFRLWVLDADGNVLAERRTDDGLQSMGGMGGFPGIMESHLAETGAPASLPVIVCGMAGARQGWVEARYLDTPTPLGCVVEGAVRVEGLSRDVRILPGVAQRDPDHPDVIRGEETQLLGALASDVEDGLFCMPGTHSKWVALRAGTLEAFATYMTGELFGLLSRQSILAHAIDDPKVKPDDPDFLSAVEAGTARPADIANRVFEIRPAQLLGFSPAGSGAARLSGVLIGTEITGARARFGRLDHVHLIASGSLSKLYAGALEASGSTVTMLDADEVVRLGLYTAARRIWS